MRGLGLVIYGSEGVGKTSLALQAPKPLRCISIRDSGFLDLQDADEVPSGCQNVDALDWSDVLTETNQSDDVRTVVYDNLTGIAQYMRDQIVQDIYSDDENPEKSFGAFSEGWRLHGPNYMDKFCRQCDILRNKGINVIILGHTKISKSKNFISQDYQSAFINLEEWPRDYLTAWAQAVLFLTLDFDIHITKKWRGTPTEAKTTQSLDEHCSRVIYTSKHPAHSAKNRLSLPPYISMGESAAEAYQNLIKHFPPRMKEALMK